jgi:hypothetical protein
MITGHLVTGLHAFLTLSSVIDESFFSVIETNLLFNKLTPDLIAAKDDDLLSTFVILLLSHVPASRNYCVNKDEELFLFNFRQSLKFYWRVANI